MTTQEFDKAVTAFVLAYRAEELRADDEGWITVNRTQDGRYDSAYDEWLEENLDKFKYDDSERDFAQWKSGDGKKPRDCKESSEVESLWKEYSKREDGGPGSGNHNHEGVPGQRGESAPSGETTDKGKNSPSYPESVGKDIRNLLDRHTMGGDQQADADYEIAHHIARKDTIGKAILEKSVIEEQAWKEQCEKAKNDEEERYEESIADLKEATQPGGYLENYSMEQLEDMGLVPAKPEYVEPMFYRKGELGGATMSFSTNPNGANMSPLTNGEEGEIGYDHAFTMSEMKDMGYVPIAGIKGFDVGASGESEVMFAAKEPTEEQLGALKHNPVSIYSLPNERREEALGERDRIMAERDDKLKGYQDAFMEKMNAPGEKDYAKIAKDMKAKTDATIKEANDALTSLGKKYDVTLGDNVVPYSLENDPKFDGGPGSGNHGHAGVPGQVGGSAPSEGGKSESKEMSISDSLKPSGTGYNYSLDKGFDDFVRFNMGNRRNPKALYDLYHKTEDAGGNGVEAVKDEYYKTRMEMCSKDFKEIGKNEADEILADNLRAGTVQAWFREYNHEVKDALAWQMTQSPEVHNAALNIMYDNYKYQCQAEGSEAKPYNEFLTTPIKMYRGGTGQEYDTPGAFSSYTFDRKVAEKFTGSDVGQGASYNPNGVVYEAEIRPIDTYGSVFSNGESEILVPRMIAPNKNRDSADEEHVDGQDKKLMGKEAFSDKIFLFGNAYFQKKLLDYGVGCANVTSEKNKDGGPGSGNHGHAGVPGQVGGSAPSGKSEEEPSEPEKGTIEHPSATGSNVPCTGFKDKNHAKSHKRKHGKEFGFTSREEYEKAAIDFIKQPVGGDIDGYKRETGAVVRFNTKTGEFGVGFPGREVLTYFKARYNSDTGEVNIQAANNYFKARKEEEAYDD